MIQLWVNLPAKDKNAVAGYQTLLEADIPAVKLADQAGTLRVIAGDYQGKSGPARSFTPINMWDLQLKSGGETSLELPEGHAAGLVVLRGNIVVNGTEPVHGAQFVLLDRNGGEVTIAASSDASVLLLSGEPIDEPVAWQGPS